MSKRLLMIFGLLTFGATHSFAQETVETTERGSENNDTGSQSESVDKSEEVPSTEEGLDQSDDSGKDESKAVAPSEEETPAAPEQEKSSENKEKVEELSPLDRFDSTPKLKELRDEVVLFEREFRVLKKDVRRLVDFQRERRIDEVEARYRRIIDQLAIQERQRREDAIEQFESFVRRYPKEEKYTPSALLRLAQLHYEYAEDKHFLESEEFEKLLTLYEDGKLKDVPEEPKIDYERTVEIFAQLISDWPESGILDGAYYMNGYCLEQMELLEAAQQNFNILVNQFPDSIYAQEGWWRIGNYFFDAGKLDKAIAAYLKVIEDKEGSHFYKGLYQLAWSYFRADEYIKSVNRFSELIRLSDEDESGRGANLREESIQYLAISLQEDDWDDDGEPDLESGLARVRNYLENGHKFEIDVVKRLMKVLFDNARYELMVEIAQYYLARFPADSENPAIHQSMIEALSRSFLIDEAFDEREALVRNYGEGSKWREQNIDNEEILEKTDELIEEALILSAQKFHRDAQKNSELAAKGDEAAKFKAESLYGQAAKAYRRYLKKFPASKNAYELKYYLADCHYGARELEQAAVVFSMVINDKSDDVYLELSAWAAAEIRQELAKNLALEGKLPSVPSLLGAAYQEPASSEEEGENDGKPIKLEPIPLPPIVQDLADARLVYIELPAKYIDPKNAERKPVSIFRLAEYYYDFKDYPKARERLINILDNFADSKVAPQAALLLIKSFRDVNDWKNVAVWAEKIDKMKFGKALGTDLRTLQVGALFKDALRLFEEGQFQKAADEYIRLVNENPDSPDAASALNNAAVAFEKLRKFQSAGEAYQRIVKEYPKSEFVEDALFKVGNSYEKVFDYTNAVTTFNRLFREFPQSRQRADYLYLEATSLQTIGRLADAAKRYEDYARVFPNREDTPETFFRAAELYKRLKDDRNLVRVYRQFVQRYENDPSQNARVLESLLGQARILKKSNSTRRAIAMYQEVLNEFGNRGLEAGSAEAKYPAEAAFELVDYEFRDYQRLEISGSLARQGKIIQDLRKRGPDLKRKYGDILKFRILDWMIAALYRAGQVDELLAEKLYEVPVPENLDIDAQDAYREQLDEFARPYEERAIKAYEYAIEQARQNAVMNEWTENIQTALNKSNAEEYPLFKKEVRPQAVFHLSNRFMLLPPEKPNEGKKEGTQEKKPEEPISTVGSEDETTSAAPSEQEGTSKEPEKADNATEKPETDNLKETNTAPNSNPASDVESKGEPR